MAADLFDEAAVTGLTGGRALAGGPGALDLVRLEPRGVVGVITPWNDPFPAAAGLIAAALVTGNTVVHKPSERSAAPGARLTELVAGCLPAGVLGHVEGDGAAGEALAADPGVDLVAHVGSSAAGASVRVACAARGAAAVTENGGKDAIVVDAGVDPAWAAEQVATGAFANAGQLCTSVERVYLHADVAEAVLAELVKCAEALVVGDPADPRTTLCPLVDERALTTVDAHVQAAVGMGARLLTGGPRPAVGPTATVPRRPTCPSRSRARTCAPRAPRWTRSSPRSASPPSPRTRRWARCRSSAPGMKSHPGVAARVFSTLGEEGINIEMISTSPIKISCVVSAEAVDRAVRALHQAFELGADQVEAEHPFGPQGARV